MLITSCPHCSLVIGPRQCSKPAAEVRQGYNLIHWTKSGMTYWAVSDLNLAELQQLAEQLQSQ